MNVTIPSFGFSMTSPVSWMRFTDLFGFFFFLGQRKRRRCWWAGGRGGMNVTILGFGFSVTSPVAWMGLIRDLFGFLCGLV
jgi:hypothetical protein